MDSLPDSKPENRYSTEFKQILNSRMEAFERVHSKAANLEISNSLCRPILIPPQWTWKCFKKKSTPSLQTLLANSTSPAQTKIVNLHINLQQLPLAQPSMPAISVPLGPLARIENAQVVTHPQHRRLHTKPSWTANSSQIAQTRDALSDIPRCHCAVMVPTAQLPTASSLTSRPCASSTRA